MRKGRLLLLVLGMLLVFGALAPVPQVSAWECLCEYRCWVSGNQNCFQNECCEMYCCDRDDPYCMSIC